ncbi:hypothetical protein DSECCO2_385130 [anaerobic digester metagenome]
MDVLSDPGTSVIPSLSSGSRLTVVCGRADLLKGRRNTAALAINDLESGFSCAQRSSALHFLRSSRGEISMPWRLAKSLRFLALVSPASVRKYTLRLTGPARM